MITINELAIKLNHPNKSNGIATKASELGLKIRTKWTKDMDEILIKYYPSGNWEEINKKLPNLNKDQVYNRVRKLNISSECFWSNKEILLLKEFYPNYSNKYLSKNYFKNKKPNDIRTFANKIGLKKSDEKSIHWYNKEEILENLLILSQELGRTPHWTELIKNGLPSLKSFERYFGGYRNACKLCDLDINFSSFGNKEKLKSKNGDWCLSIGEIIITDFFIDNNLEYIKEASYAKYSSLNIFGNKRCDWYLPKFNLFVEYFGMASNNKYAIKMNNKIKMCKDNNLKLLEIYDKDVLDLNKIISKII